MTTRSQQRIATRDRIVKEALMVFAEFGFRGASTREVAGRADISQGLLTYHFKSKEELWYATADYIFDLLIQALTPSMMALRSNPTRESSRQIIRDYTKFAAKHPELVRLMIEEGKHSDGRLAWLTEKYLRPMYHTFRDELIGIPKDMKPHAFYAFVSASSIIFSVATECKNLTGLKPNSKKAIEVHADYVANLIIPNST